MEKITSRKSHSRRTRKSGRANIRQHPLKVKNSSISKKLDTGGKAELEVQKHKKIAELETKKEEKHIQDKAKIKTERLEKKAELDTLKANEYSKTKAKIEKRNEAKHNQDPRKRVIIPEKREVQKTGIPEAKTHSNISGANHQSETIKPIPEDQQDGGLNKEMKRIINKK